MNLASARPVEVFVVEDSRLLRERLASVIKEIPGLAWSGAAADAPHACGEIERLRPGLVILDLQLERGSGWDVLAALNRLPDPPRVIVLTNHADEEHRQRSLERGAAYFFDKSTGLDQFLETLQGIAEDPGFGPPRPSPS
ncbi:MAG: response regulator [Acidobacteria bacterium]|nr:response regulator [Acidobacteriota bacterium]